MTVTDVQRDAQELTMTVTSEFDAPPTRVWSLWADPRLLEQWWGPPGYPATVVDHDLRPGGAVSYYMTGPEGDRHRGWWKIHLVDAPKRLELEDGFAYDDGNPNADMPVMRLVVTIDERPGGGTRMAIATRFPSIEAMHQLLEMGMDEGIRAALAQADALLAA